MNIIGSNAPHTGHRGSGTDPPGDRRAERNPGKPPVKVGLFRHQLEALEFVLKVYGVNGKEGVMK